jgi:5-deoxy-glucuronate isomerase
MTGSRNEWFFRRGGLSAAPWQSVVDGSIPGWRYSALRIAELQPGESVQLPAAGLERLLVPLAGSFDVTHGRDGDGSGERDAAARQSVRLEGRASVFDGPSDVLYLSADSAATVSGPGRIAVAEAPATRILPSRHITKSEVPVELRGAGRSSRQVHNFGVPDVLEADRFIVCEVITPAENWSSYPPHKHDTRVPGQESRLEEIYYFESAVSRSLAAPEAADPFGYMRSYSSDAGEIDILAEVRTGDIALVPHGWHGPCVAAPGYDLYYLNVMAGPDEERVWQISDDPAHGWVRQTWEGQDPDPRLPYDTTTME